MSGGDFERMPERRPSINGDWLAIGLLLIAQVGLGLFTLLIAALTAVITANCGPSVPCGGDGWTTAAIWTAIGGGLILLAAGLILAVRRYRRGRRGWPMVMTTFGLQIVLLVAVNWIGHQAGPI